MTGQELLSKAIKWLEAQPPSTDQDYRAETLEQAYRLVGKKDPQVLSLFFQDPEQLGLDLQRNQDSQQVYQEHAEALEAALKGADEGALLAENLYNSLQHRYPSFGRLSPST